MIRINFILGLFVVFGSHGIGQALDDSVIIVKYREHVARTGDTLTIMLKNHQTKSFINKRPVPNNDGESFQFEAYLEDHGYFLIRYSWWEGDDYFLVRDEDGNSFGILGYPYLSPNGKYFAMASMDVAHAMNANAIEISEFVGDSIYLRYSIEPEGWGPETIRWISDDSLFVLRSIPTDSTFMDYVQSPAVVVRKHNSWILKDHY